MAPVSVREPIREGGLSFAYEREELHKGVARVFVSCPLCRRTMLVDSVRDHLTKHQARDAKASGKAALRELGAVAKPLPGQLGLFAPVQRIGRR